MRWRFKPHKIIDCAANFQAALAFLTRIPYAPKSFSLVATLPYTGLAGLFVGLVATAGCLSFYKLAGQTAGILAAITAGWLWLTLEIWLTRALHWDGVADLGDAWGSAAQGERFWKILKDSRLGAFGAIALVLLMALQCSAVALHLGTAIYWPLALAPAWARLSPSWLGYGRTAHSTSKLGDMICGNVTKSCFWLAWLQAGVILTVLCAIGVSLTIVLALAAAQLTLNWWFGREAKKRGGLSGDFFGCHIEMSQTLFLLVTACRL